MTSLNGVRSIRFIEENNTIVNRTEGEYTFYKIEKVKESGLYVELIDSVVFIPLSHIREEMNKGGYKVVKR